MRLFIVEPASSNLRIHVLIMECGIFFNMIEKTEM